MENLNAEQVISELDCQTRFAKFANSNGVLISAKCAQFVLDHVQYYEQRIKELTEENERLTRLANLRQRDLDNANDLLFKAEDEIERLMREKTALECIVSTARNQAKADTVRKMQTAIEEYYSKPTYQPTKDHPIKHTQIEHLLVVIDQIAKKMLEGGNEN